MSQPELFIVESLDFEDEQAKRFEGRIIRRILALSGKKCEYHYVQTKRELKAALKRFSSSHYRYLHLSCHGNKETIFTKVDPIPFADFGPLIKPYLRKRRLFVSACSATNPALAKVIMPGSGCYSILGPDQDIDFDDATILWASFYHVMFSADSNAMKYKIIKAKAREVSNMFRIRLTLIGHDEDRTNGYKIRSIVPSESVSKTKIPSR